MDLEWIKNQPRQVEVGDRIKLVNMPDDPHPLEAGTEGTVTSVDTKMEVIGVKWDNGSRLNLILGVDSFNILNESASDKAIINKSMPKPTLKGRNISPTRTTMNNNFKTALKKGKVKDIKVESEKLVGGKADGLSPSDISKKHKVELKEIQKEIELGIEIEMEHTDNPIKAKEIVMDHLFEFPDYYTNEKHGLNVSEKGLEKVHETTILEFFGAFGKKNKDDKYNLETLGRDLKKITDTLKTATFPSRETVRTMIEKFREKYSEHSQIDTIMKSLYYEFDKIGGGDIEETTTAGSSGAFSGPLGGIQKRNESKIIKVKDLLESTTTKNINWKDGNLDISSEIPKEKKIKAKIKKEDLIRTVRLLENKEYAYIKFYNGETQGTMAIELGSPNHTNMINGLVDLGFKFTKISKDEYDNDGDEITIQELYNKHKGEIDETTTASSSGQYSGPMFAAKNDKNWNLGKKPIWRGGKIVQKVKNSGVLSEINKVKWHNDGSYVKLKDSCVKYNNQPWCNQGAIDNPLILSKTTFDNISEVAKKLGISEEEIKKVVINQLTR